MPLDADVPPEPEAAPDAEAIDPASPFPPPEHCRKSPSIAGVPATLADGREWLLAYDGLRRVPARYRDDLYDEWVLTGRVSVATARAAAYLLLRANYDLPEDDALALILGADPAGYCDAVIEAMLAADPSRKTWTVWAQSALLANGIRPADVPPEHLAGVLRQLIVTGRAEAPEEFTDSGVAAGKRAGLMTLAAHLEREKPKAPKPAGPDAVAVAPADPSGGAE